ncbi:unnamed protein product [Blepharisma stoltei]|uniref:Uncharacterized protein n=1 Tax=Blepharisma stoltei TaxID=1481888 RepID=A0AAU9JIK3_9CILI|nr:unnamed protein product [Blepharisma stoltei]
MNELEILRNIFQSIRASRAYQNYLRSYLIELDKKLKTISIIKRQKNKKNTPEKPKKPPKPKIPIHPCFKLQQFLKKFKTPSLPSAKEFSASELSTLKTSYDKLGPNWIEISVLLNKTKIDCFRMHEKHYRKSPVFIRTLSWSKDEDFQLHHAVAKYGINNWREISNCVDGKTNSQCYHRWMKTIHPNIHRGKWDKEEDIKLALAVKVFGGNWNLIAEYVPHRTDIQCRERYCNILSPEVNSASWSESEDIRLILGVCYLGKRWSKIAKLVKLRTDNQCWRRFKILAKRSKLLFSLSALTILQPKIPKKINPVLQKMHILRSKLNKVINSCV